MLSLTAFWRHITCYIRLKVEQGRQDYSPRERDAGHQRGNSHLRRHLNLRWNRKNNFTCLISFSIYIVFPVLDGRKLSSEGKITVHENGTLVINAVAASDAGTYSCTASNRKENRIFSVDPKYFFVTMSLWLNIRNVYCEYTFLTNEIRFNCFALNVSYLFY